MDELIIQSKNGNKLAFSKLILSIKEELYRIAKEKLTNEEDIQDALQNTIVNAYIGINNLKNNKYFKTWIIKILINECNRIYKYNKKQYVLLDKMYNTSNIETYNEEPMEFDNIIDLLNESEKKIIELYYKNDLSIKQISHIMNMNENTIKTKLRRGKKKIKQKLKHSSIMVIILCILFVSSVIGASIISYIKNLFETNSIGLNNNNILMAIENLEWYQQTDMNYIDLGDGNSVKIEYFLADEMNLYMIFDMELKNDISKFDNISFSDIKITNENGEVICDRKNVLNKQAKREIGDKLIEKGNHNIKSLLYLYMDEFPNSKKLNICLSEITLYTMNTTYIINTNVNIELDVPEKFINKELAVYKADKSNIKKAISTSTGFYAIVESNKHEIINAKLIDNKGKIYECYYSYLTGNNIEYIIIANFDSIENKELKLIINDKEYNLLMIKQ